MAVTPYLHRMAGVMIDAQLGGVVGKRHLRYCNTRKIASQAFSSLNAKATIYLIRAISNITEYDFSWVFVTGCSSNRLIGSYVVLPYFNIKEGKLLIKII